eukprot:590015_1
MAKVVKIAKEHSLPSSIYHGPLSLYKTDNDILFNSWCNNVYGRLTDTHLCCYQNGAKRSNTITFKLAIDNIVSIEDTSDSVKQPFITIKTKEHDDIYLSASYKSMSQWYSALCNAICEYKNSIDTLKSFDESIPIPDPLMCPICHEIYTNPVKNTSGHTYCYQKCILPWYKKSIHVLRNIKDETHSKSVHDPKTNCPLPQGCLLLIPDFKCLIETYRHINPQGVPEADRIKYMRYDAYLNHYRKKLVQKPLHTAIHQHVIKIGANDDGLFTSEKLRPVVDEIWRLFDIQSRVDGMIESSVADWNASYGQIVPFEWAKAELDDSSPVSLAADHKKIMANEMMKDYGIDEAFEGLLHEIEIDAFVSDIIAVLIQHVANVPFMNGNCALKMIDETKEKMIAMILRRQEEIRERYAATNTSSTDNDGEDVDTQTQQSNVITIDTNHQIWWEDNMRCVREMFSFVKKGETFEVIFEDTAGELTRNKLLRFLQFGGFDRPVSIQKTLYKGMAKKLQYEILKLSSGLQQDTYVHATYKCTNYWKYVMEVGAIKNPDRNKKGYRDYLWLKVRLRLNYDEELSKFDYGTGSRNAKHKLKKELRNQLAHHLGLSHRHYIHIHDIYSGSIMVIVGLSIGGFAFLAEKIYMCSSIHNGNHQKWLTPKKSAVASAAASSAVLGIVGAVAGYHHPDHALGKLIMDTPVGDDIAHRLSLSAGPIGAIVGGLAGVVLAGAVFTVCIGYAQCKKNEVTRAAAKERHRSSYTADESDDEVRVRIPLSSQEPNPSESTYLSLLSEKNELEEPLSATHHSSTAQSHWKEQFVMKTICYSATQSLESALELGARKILLDCGHEFEQEDVDTSSEYLVTCLECGKRSHVVKERGGGAISYRHIFEHSNEQTLNKQ